MKKVKICLFESFAPSLEMEKDFVIAATFGGLLLGLGFGYVIKYGGTSGGTDIPIKILNRKLKLPLSVSIYLIDGIVILLGVIVFYDQYGIVTGLYAILSMFISGKVADMVVVGSNANKAVQIITDNPKEIKDSIFEYLERGVTELKIYGGYTKIEKTMLITVITRNEYYSLRNIIADLGLEPEIHRSDCWAVTYTPRASWLPRRGWRRRPLSIASQQQHRACWRD